MINYKTTLYTYNEFIKDREAKRYEYIKEKSKKREYYD